MCACKFALDKFTLYVHNKRKIKRISPKCVLFHILFGKFVKLTTFICDYVMREVSWSRYTLYFLLVLAFFLSSIVSVPHSVSVCVCVCVFGCKCMVFCVSWMLDFVWNTPFDERTSVDEIRKKNGMKRTATKSRVSQHFVLIVWEMTVTMRKRKWFFATTKGEKSTHTENGKTVACETETETEMKREHNPLFGFRLMLRFCYFLTPKIHINWK